MVKTSHMHTVQKKRKTMQLTDIGICAGLIVPARVHMPGRVVHASVFEQHAHWNDVPMPVPPLSTSCSGLCQTRGTI